MAIGPRTSQARSLRSDQACTLISLESLMQINEVLFPLGRHDVGVKNGRDEVNTQNIRRRKIRTVFDKYFFGKDSFLRRTLRRKHETSEKSPNKVARSLHSDQTHIPLGRYVATELFRNVDTTRVHAFSSTLRCYLPKTVPNPFHVFRHSKSSIKLCGENRGKFVLYRKKP